ncbi:MAG: DEAD/DEAH box helicase [Sediminibacterium sp.]
MTLKQLLSESPNYSHLVFDKVKLLPHQIAIYQSVLSRWPVNSLIADEVGLGKTIEAGAVMRYATTFLQVQRIAVLVPSSLRNQWQAEMYHLFGVKCFIYEPEQSRLVFYQDGEITDEISNVTPGNYFNHGVNRIIFSWHYLRQSGTNGQFKLSADDEIDMIVVDEAHGARASQQPDGDIDSTKLHQFLSEIGPVIPHKLLLTATPFQTSAEDYVSLLNLLMGENGVDKDSMDRISLLNRHYNLQSQQEVDAVTELLNNTAYRIDGLPSGVTLDDPAALYDLYDDRFYIRNHPTTIYTARNTRDQLKKIGYKFPEAQISSIAVELESKQSDLIQLINSYVENYLFNFERAIGVRGLGLVKTVYNQRIVSSFQACYTTFQKRYARLQSYVAEQAAAVAVTNSANEDDIDIVTIGMPTAPITDSQIGIAKTEMDFVGEILIKLSKRLFIGNDIVDPKIEEALRIILHHLSQQDKVIVFSRFTSTTAYLVDRLSQLDQFSFGRFEGDFKQVIKGEQVEEVSRQSIARRFAQGEFPVIVCSDAASEGLNLQAGNVVINVDVPWNPARILQRFGRIDRFGQQKEILYFYNLFYPGTIEDRMYARLHRRNLEFRELLGTTPDITSIEHLRFLNILGNDTHNLLSYENTLLRLEPSDNIRPHEIILEHLAQISAFTISETAIVYEGNSYDYSTSELNPSYLDLAHPLFAHIEQDLSGLTGLYNAGVVLLFVCVTDHEKAYPIIGTAALLRHVVLRKWLTGTVLTNGISLMAPEVDFMRFLSLEGKNVINHNKVSFNNSIPNELYQGLHFKKM